MSVRIEVQTRVHSLISAGTFNQVTYNKGTHLPIEGGPQFPKSIAVNEISGGFTDSASTGATSSDYVIRNWRFEAVVEFSNEVLTDYFILNELRKLNFSVDNLLVTIVPSGDFQVTQSPRQGSHNGTKLTIGLTVNTRR